MKRLRLVFPALTGVGLIIACSSNSGGGAFVTGSDGGPTTTPIGTGDGGVTIAPGSGTGTTGMLGNSSGTGTSAPTSEDGGVCPWSATNGGTTDHDGDGWTPADGDCDDCNKYINPGAYDIPSDGIDEDCDGHVDDEPTGCDSTVGTTSPATSTGSDGAKAMDICRTTTSSPPLPMKTWGLLAADYVLPDGSSTPQNPGGLYTSGYGCTFSDATGAGSPYNLGIGILGPTFGTSNHTQEGVRMLGLSSGSARAPDQSGYQNVSGYDKCYVSGAPAGFPASTPACPGVMFGKPHDGAAIRLILRVPTNALTMSFDENFFSFEFPDYVCSPYNDTFVAIMTPSPAGEPATANDNISFDSKGNIISVNAGFLTVCTMNTNAGGMTYACAEGPSKLAATGFGSDNSESDGENHASTDWLTTTVSVANLAGQEITLLLAIWDSTDGILDSTILIDNLHWTFATGPNMVPPPVQPPMTQPK